MSSGKIVASMLVLVAVMAGLAVWYLQVYGFYDEVDEISGAQEIVVTDAQGATHPVAVGDFKAIDAASSPIRYRACFTLDPAGLADAAPYPAATPLNGPGWFKCYSARALTADLESGAARAVLGQAEIRPDVDRVIVVYPDGRAFAWHQFNDKTPERGVMD
ncbi:DUF6446 family protein [Paracoccus sp. PS-1]|uniref:DUF6446 family protein n=1 Tax=unclassified Paracoccus (in: a-proteobacteria) TaxID=2688777 RepID=UPI00048E4E97|nr:MULTISPECIES: DUF6446 family protein [unclassified Paracoccus (in: a-proteobacteria)]MDQ7260399.1 DUF6446 family protein [Paracoccus sp. PS1]UFM66309.1 DUF6446 family protein [Paracoccus sp. MA]